MTISIAGRLPSSENGLSEEARKVLSSIDGGTQWLQRASADPSHHHEFPDEPALIAGVRDAVQDPRPGSTSAGPS